SWPPAASTKYRSKPAPRCAVRCCASAWSTSCWCTWRRCCLAPRGGRCSMAWISTTWPRASASPCRRCAPSAATCACACCRRPEMFTGIIEAMGRIDRIEPQGGDLRLGVRIATCDDGAGGVAPVPDLPWPDPLRLGVSIAVSGVCLTVLDFDAYGFLAYVSYFTLTL